MLGKVRVCVPIRGVGVRGWHRRYRTKRDTHKLRSRPGGCRLTSGVLAANDAGWIRGLGFRNGAARAPAVLAARQLCVTTQLWDQPLMLSTSEHQSVLHPEKGGLGSSARANSSRGISFSLCRAPCFHVPGLHIATTTRGEVGRSGPDARSPFEA